MADIGFDNKVAIITGAGGGLGREHALLLASRGAQIVINDLGGTVDGSGEGTEGPAHTTAKEINDLGGVAVADTNSVATPEGGEAMAPTIRFLTERGIPVMAHVGLTPQAVNALGGYGARGQSQEEHAKILADAKAVADAGAFSMVLEGVLESLAQAVTQTVDIPVIGIGASADCDGQVLVTDDMLGMFDRVPRFVKRYHEVANEIVDAASQYAADVRSRSFPTQDQTYQPK